tara:strand:- start:336 stop:878 length:543 start_codon:yes stop_codon:yes gene_type:complete
MSQNISFTAHGYIMKEQMNDQINWKRAQIIWLIFLATTLLGSLCFALWINLSRTSSEIVRVLLPSLIVITYLLQISSFLATYVYRRGANEDVSSHYLKQSKVSLFYYVFSSLFWVYFIGAVIGFSKVRGALYPISGLDASLAVLFAFYAVIQLSLFLFSVRGLLSAGARFRFNKVQSNIH